MKTLKPSIALFTFCLLASGLQIASAAAISFVGRTDAATGVYDLTALGTTDWAYWSTADNPIVGGVATNEMSGGTSISGASGTGGVTSVRGTGSSGGTVADFSYTNGTSTASGTAFNPNGVFNTDLSGPGKGVELGFTLADAGQWYTVNIWTAGFATQFAQVTGSLDGATSYTNTSGGYETVSPNEGNYGGYNTPKEQYQYTFNVLADSANDVFNFDIRTAGSTGGSRHVLITAASISAIPEPSSLALASLVVVGFTVFGRRRLK
ncbi:PEP-CTERM sorting domain-containing protein [Kiritimatiellaeota bacterium B1221]|nr:PEP-CTERM sorting domain-containing protein [Kiritimatiellaeota bacterium B1221]